MCGREIRSRHQSYDLRRALLSDEVLLERLAGAARGLALRAVMVLGLGAGFVGFFCVVCRAEVGVATVVCLAGGAGLLLSFAAWGVTFAVLGVAFFAAGLGVGLGVGFLEVGLEGVAGLVRFSLSREFS